MLDARCVPAAQKWCDANPVPMRQLSLDEQPDHSVVTVNLDWVDA